MALNVSQNSSSCLWLRYLNDSIYLLFLLCFVFGSFFWANPNMKSTTAIPGLPSIEHRESTVSNNVSCAVNIAHSGPRGRCRCFIGKKGSDQKFCWTVGIVNQNHTGKVHDAHAYQIYDWYDIIYSSKCSRTKIRVFFHQTDLTSSLIWTFPFFSPQLIGMLRCFGSWWSAMERSAAIVSVAIAASCGTQWHFLWCHGRWDDI